MNFEQYPQEPPKEEIRPSKKKGLAILGMVGALAGGMESEAHADTRKTRDAKTEKKGGLERQKEAADARWNAPGNLEIIEKRTEARGFDGRIVLFYGGTNGTTLDGEIMRVKGYTIIDQGDPSKTGDEHWIDIRQEEHGQPGSKMFSSTRTSKTDDADFLMNNPFAHELAGAAPTGNPDVQTFLHITSEAYWELYAAKAAAQDGRAAKKALQDVLTYGSEYLGMIAKGQDQHEAMKTRVNAKLKLVEDFVGTPKGR